MTGATAARETPWPSASTRLLAVLGSPVRHSLSPVIHNAALRAQGVDLAYVALPVEPGHLPEVVWALGAVGVVGANVTVPHKQAAVACCDHVTDEARLVGAVNTLTWTPGGDLVGDNTDALGLQRALDQVGAATGAAVVLGTGGAARAAVVALVRRGAAVTVVGRRAEAAAEVAEVAGTAGGKCTSLGLDDRGTADAVAGADLVVNATPLGMAGEDLPAPFMALRAGQGVYDLVYTPPDTPFLQAARAAGAAAHGGLSMLVHQAAVAYPVWTGRPAPIEVMTAAAEAALAAG